MTRGAASDRARPADALPSAVAIVPARLGSTRLPRKMLLRETGRYLFEHTVERVLEAPAIDAVYLATDSAEIARAAAQCGIEALMTSDSHPSGTDRVHEAYEALIARGDGPWDVVVNVQGDEPELPGGDLTRLVGAFRAPEVELGTLQAPLLRPADLEDPAVVKVVVDGKGDALYFSRAPIPCVRAAGGSDAELAGMRRHVGVYAFRPVALARFCSLPRGTLERIEGLEQLRWLEAGLRLRVIEAETAPAGIDTPEQYAAFLERTRQDPASPPDRAKRPVPHSPESP